MFIRKKKVKKQEYVYLVKNKWHKRKKAPKQRVVAYLGRNYRPEKIRGVGFVEFYDIDDIDKYIEKNTKEIFLDLIKKEIESHNLEGFKVELEEGRILDKNNRAISLEINEGFLNSYTLSNLMNFKMTKDKDGMEQGREFADVLTSAGIKIERELFVRLFQKMKTSSS